MKTGFIGLGVMGHPMAMHLQAGGHELHVVRRPSTPADILATGAVVHDSARALAAAADLVILMLPDTPDVEQVLFGADGVAAGLPPGRIVVDMSSISPRQTRVFADRLAAQGCTLVDAPVSGGQVGARNASLTIMVGAEPAMFEQLRPLFGLMGKNVTRVGPSGSGQVTKVANQIIVALTIEAVAEGLLFAARAGADPASVRAALMGGFASSRILEVHGERMIKRTFDPGFRIRLHQKDLAIALSEAKAMGLALPGTGLAQSLFSACAANGGADSDHSALVRALELLANHALA